MPNCFPQWLTMYHSHQEGMRLRLPVCSFFGGGGGDSPWWSWFADLQWLLVPSIFSYARSPLQSLFEKIVCASPLPIFNWFFLFLLLIKSSFLILIIDPHQIPELQIFSLIFNVNSVLWCLFSLKESMISNSATVAHAIGVTFNNLVAKFRSMKTYPYVLF